MSMLGIGDTAPDFHAETSEGPIDFYDFAADGWVVLFSHPHFFRPVCVSEMGQASRLAPDFVALGCKLLAVTVDPLDRFEDWQADIVKSEATGIRFPVVSDPERQVTALYGLIHPAMSPEAPTRSAYIIDPQRRVRALLAFPSSMGRDFAYILTLVNSLQLTDRAKVASPAGWRPGDEMAIVPGLSAEELSSRFPAGWREATPYLRYVQIPSK
ncbi:MULTISPECIES: redoxin domain-containing protein [unclassified Chelatococcus]|uniref:redoxin domain-containing protein n=1 Tax=unclassified Chelatococcus TaxID=2638111 RepID=UPI001BCC17AE|nr:MULTISPECIES: redoxin domain-containing protein [unclassified Chelatococcus]MBS7700460.1 redoxin domain-containing protein [Chelatococcus sp. YT9]MBX3556256.1 redoxin domain-containing protein [Chelatococcus sp.]